MSSNLEAAEALLATVEAARGQMRAIAHQRLPFSVALALEVDGTVGASAERAMLGLPYSPIDLIRLSVAFSAERRAAPPAPAATRLPAAALPTSPGREGLDASEIPTGEFEPVSLHSAAGSAAGDADEEATFVGAGLAAAAATGAAAAALAAAYRVENAGDDGDPISLDDLVHDDADLGLESAWKRSAEADLAPSIGNLPVEDPGEDEQTFLGRFALPVAAGREPEDDMQVPDPAAEPEPSRTWADDLDADDGADDDAAAAPDLEEADFENEDVEPTHVARMSSELFAAIARPRSVSPAVGPAADADRPLVRWADDPAPAPAPAARSSWEDAEDWSDRQTQSGRASVLTPPELVEHDSFDDATNVAAVQILGVGKARALSPTLELGDASGADEEPEYDDPADGDDPGLRVSFEEPEYDAEPRAAIPELTADVEPDGESLVVVTQDGLQHRDGASVADADVDAGQLKNLLSDARAAEARGNLQEAVLHYGDLLSLQPSNLEAHLGRGRSLVELGDYAAAMSDFQRAEDIAPHSPDPIVEMGNLFFARKEYRKSITYYDQAVEMAPDHAMAWCRRGICHHYRKNHSQAFKDLQKAVSLDPDIPNLRKYVQMARKAMERAER